MGDLGLLGGIRECLVQHDTVMYYVVTTIVLLYKPLSSLKVFACLCDVSPMLAAAALRRL